MIHHQLSTKQGLLRTAKGTIKDFCYKNNLPLVPVHLQEIPGVDGGFDERLVRIYVSLSVIERYKIYTPERALYEYSRVIRHELEHYKDFCKGIRLSEIESERKADKTSIVSAAETMLRYNEDEINPILPEIGSGIVAGVGIGTGFKLADQVWNALKGKKNPLSKKAIRDLEQQGWTFWMEHAKNREHAESIKLRYQKSGFAGVRIKVTVGGILGISTIIVSGYAPPHYDPQKNPAIKAPAGYRYFDNRPNRKDAEKLGRILEKQGWQVGIGKGYRVWHVFVKK